MKTRLEKQSNLDEKSDKYSVTKIEWWVMTHFLRMIQLWFPRQLIEVIKHSGLFSSVFRRYRG